MQQSHLPKDETATESQQWGWELSDFLADNYLYIIGILIIIAVVWFTNKKRR